jgi:predicted Zn-dependent protease
MFPLLMFSGCSAVRDINLYSTGEEVEFGNQLDKEVVKEYKILDDSYLTDFVESRGQLLVQHSERKDITYHFKVVDSDVMNAFAIPGGYCYINLGLIRRVDTETELMSVIAHEINHVVHQHSMKRLSQMQLANIVTSVALGKNSGQMQQIAANLFTSTGMLYYSREAEREADHSGLITMYDAGYDPNGMVELFKKLSDQHEGKEAGGVEYLFSSHPVTSERIENAQNLIGTLPEKKGLIVNSDQWADVLKYVKEKYPVEDAEK